MFWIFLILLMIILLGPLRRPYLRHGRYTIPATAGLIVGLIVGSYVMSLAGVSGLMALAIPIAMALGLAGLWGQTAKGWSDRTFGERNRPRGGTGT